MKVEMKPDHHGRIIGLVPTCRLEPHSRFMRTVTKYALLVFAAVIIYSIAWWLLAIMVVAYLGVLYLLAQDYYMACLPHWGDQEVE